MQTTQTAATELAAVLNKRCSSFGQRDLTSSSQQQEILSIATTLVEGPGDLRGLEEYCCASASKQHPIVLEAIKCALGRDDLTRCPPCHLTVVFAMYKEDKRILPKVA